jgi:hypothetical protein
MVRNFDKFKESLDKHHKWQLDYFNVIKGKLLKKASEWKVKGDLERHDSLLKEAGEMRFVHDKSTSKINYGRCSKFDKDVSFIPNVCIPENKDCFLHRRDEIKIDNK